MIALDPNAKFEMKVLVTEVAEKPAILVFKFPTGAELARIDALADEAEAAAMKAELARIDALPDEANAAVVLEGDKLLEALNLLLKDVRADAEASVSFVLDVDAAERKRRITVPALPAEVSGEIMAVLADPDRRTISQLVPQLQQLVEKIKPSLSPQEIHAATVFELQEILRKAVLLSRIRGNGSPIAAGVLSREDLWDLVNRIGKQARLSENERKKSALRLASAATQKSAGGAGRSV